MKLIMIDPGHGGKDPGCVNNDDVPFGTIQQESILALDIALRLATIFNDPAYQSSMTEPVAAALTRSNDIMVTLADRVRQAKAAGADFFLSIHHNAREKEQSGIELETYYWDKLTPDSWSAKAAEMVQNALVDDIGASGSVVVDRGVKTANFYVLRNTACPAALTEVGFLTDKEECLWLNQEANRQLVAEALSLAMTRYFEQRG